MDITVEYTAEEKELFEEINTLREEVHVLEDEVYLLKKEKAEHTEANHTQGIPPIVFMVLSFLFFLVFAADLIVGFGLLDAHIAQGVSFAHPTLFGGTALAIGVASGAPTLGVIFAVLFIVSYRKYFYQVTKDPKLQKKAAELNIKNYYATEDRIDRDYAEAYTKLEEKRKIYTEKQERLDELMTLRRLREIEEEKNPPPVKENKPRGELKVIRYHEMTESTEETKAPEDGKENHKASVSLEKKPSGRKKAEEPKAAKGNVREKEGNKADKGRDKQGGTGKQPAGSGRNSGGRGRKSAAGKPASGGSKSGDRAGNKPVGRSGRNSTSAGKSSGNGKNAGNSGRGSKAGNRSGNNNKQSSGDGE